MLASSVTEPSIDVLQQALKECLELMLLFIADEFYLGRIMDMAPADRLVSGAPATTESSRCQ